MVFWFVTKLSEAVIVIILLFVPLEISLLVFLSDIFFRTILGRDADLVVMVDCQIPSDDLIVHFF
ncbi:hypothetical protein [Shigella flexneri]|uniref:hypothetical protein n=1 Tax=Shigella flexneri TaxID=623 RepID=UPI00316ABFD5